MGEYDMIKSLLAATTALTLMSGLAVAQSSTTTTTQSTTYPAPMPVPGVVVQSTTQRTINSDGVETDHSKTISSGTDISPSGDTVTTHRTTETTTVR
jgi:hypothetical protein